MWRWCRIYTSLSPTTLRLRGGTSVTPIGLAMVICQVSVPLGLGLVPTDNSPGLLAIPFLHFCYMDVDNLYGLDGRRTLSPPDSSPQLTGAGRTYSYTYHRSGAWQISLSPKYCQLSSLLCGHWNPWVRIPLNFLWLCGPLMDVILEPSCYPARLSQHTTTASLYIASLSLCHRPTLSVIVIIIVFVIVFVVITVFVIIIPCSFRALIFLSFNTFYFLIKTAVYKIYVRC
jgi:hypothetical protein